MRVRDDAVGAGPLYCLNTFGELQLYRCDKSSVVNEVGRKPLTLLALLAQAAPGGMERARICELLWPELDGPSARHVLSQTLYALRRQLQGTRVAVGRRDLSIAPEITSDLRQFRNAVIRQDAEAVEALYVGEFLEGLSFGASGELEHWAVSERANIALIYAGLSGARSVEGPGPLQTDEDGLAEPNSPPMQRKTRTMPRMSLALVSVLCAVTAWGVASSASGRSAEALPATVWEDRARKDAERLAARLAATDSTAIGRVLILPARNHTGRTEYDTLLGRLDYMLRELQSHEFAQPVPKELTVRVHEEIKSWRMPNSTLTQNVHLLRASGAGVLVRPAIVRLGDSVTVRLTFTRRSPNERARLGDSLGHESLNYAIMEAIGAEPRKQVRVAGSGLVRFMRTMENCKLEGRRQLFASPWCWKSRTELSVVPGAASARSEAFFEKVRERQAAAEKLSH